MTGVGGGYQQRSGLDRFTEEDIARYAAEDARNRLQNAAEYAEMVAAVSAYDPDAETDALVEDLIPDGGGRQPRSGEGQFVRPDTGFDPTQETYNLRFPPSQRQDNSLW